MLGRQDHQQGYGDGSAVGWPATIADQDDCEVGPETLTFRTTHGQRVRVDTDADCPVN